MTSDILKRTAEAVEGTTPGPWVVCDRWNVSGPKYEVMNGSIMVRNDDESDANARFIAAARTLIPDMAAAIAERDVEIERLTARAEAAEAMLEAATGMVSIVEGIDGAMNHGTWRDARGMRLKDTPEWIRLYVAYAAHAAMKEGTSTLSPIAAAAGVLLADDVAISRMAEAIHDGPLGAKGHWFSAATKQGGWCVDVARAALRALAEQEKADG